MINFEYYVRNTETDNIVAGFILLTDAYEYIRNRRGDGKYRIYKPNANLMHEEVKKCVTLSAVLR